MKKFIKIFVYLSAICFWLFLSYVVAVTRVASETDRRNARLEATSRSLEALIIPVLLHRVDCGLWPSGANGTESLVRDMGVAKWRGPYAKNEKLH